jgi:RHS repeat-associated protein
VSTCNGSRYAYVFDAADNLTSVTDPSGSTSIGYNDLNQRVSEGSSTITYDAAGNTTSDGARTYKWDAENRVVEISGAGGVTTFRYDGLGRRVQTTVTAASSTKTARSTWCGSRLCASRDGNDVSQLRYFSEGQYDVQVGRKWVTTTDHLGSVRDVIDAGSGAVVGSFDYTPYGQIASSSGTAVPDYLYAGLRFDPLQALYYSKTRAYDPASGHWLNRDPIGEQGGLNLYGYVLGNPLSYADASGLGATGAAIGGSIGGVVGGIVGGVLGGAAGGAGGTLVAPGVGTIGLGGAGAVEGAGLGAVAGGVTGAVIGSAIEDLYNWATNHNSGDDGVIDHPGSQPPFTGTPGSTVRGGTGSRTYGSDGYPETDRDWPHPDEAPPGNGDHCHDWGRPEGGGPPTHEDRGPGRPPKPGDPPAPRGPNVPPP